MIQKTDVNKKTEIVIKNPNIEIISISFEFIFQNIQPIIKLPKINPINTILPNSPYYSSFRSNDSLIYLVAAGNRP